MVGGMVSSDPALVHPAVQARSRARIERIIEAGLTLLQTHRLNEITMEMIASRADCSVGTLYRRFANKEALLIVLADAVRQDVLRQIEAGQLPAAQAEDSLLDVLCQLTEFLASLARSYEGLLRAMQLRRLTRPAGERPLRDAGQAVLAASTERLKERRPAHLAEAEFARRLGISYQVLTSTLLNMVVNQPGPLDLHADDAPLELARVMHAYLVAD